MAGGSNNVTRMSPRQRMINLMYIVLTAMLALNVSSDVLNGFRQVHKGIETSNENMSRRNDIQFAHLENLYRKNPAKARGAMESGRRLHEIYTALDLEIEKYKVEIARKADGKDGDYRNLRNQDDLEAAAVTMLNPATMKGKSLERDIAAYRDYVASLISDSVKREAVMKMLATDPEKSNDGMIPWEQSMFDNMPAIAAVTMLTKLQNDMLHAESEALMNLISAVDEGDLRVNELNAYVIPESNIVMRGGKYRARVVLAAVDSTSRPAVFVNGSRLQSSGGILEMTASGSGKHDISGYIEVPSADGSVSRQTFASSYTVIEPMATISPTMMNVLYAGIANPISISVPGVPMSSVTATMTGGTLQREGDHWVARASKIGGDAVINVSANFDGVSRQVGSMKFRVRKLPDPTPYLPLKDASGNTVNYKGTPRRISKGALLSADRLGAALDDDILNISYSVVSFSTVFFDQMGNAIPERSDGARFSERQREQFRRLRPGRSFLINNVKAKGPDGVTRDIPPLEVAIN